ncbi:MAG: hypothetical protein U0821_21030 [Chloroflexota bacterium]
MAARLRFDSIDDALEELIERFSDGLPVIPPTEARVAALLDRSTRDPDERLGEVPPRGATATVRDVAVNAVLAGCPPRAFPIALAAVEAMLDQAFNLNGLQATTHMASPMVVVSGPLAEWAGMNAGVNALGQGNRANLTIGRTLRLVMTNIGGGYPGAADLSVQGAPSKLSFCFAERADICSWPSLAERQGAPHGATTVTLLAAEGPHVVSDHRSATPERLLTNVARTMRDPNTLNGCMPSFQAFVATPQHARLLDAAGWDVPRVQAFLFEHARNSLDLLRTTGEFDERRTLEAAARYGPVDDPQTMMPVIAAPENLIVVVAGGDNGGYSAVVPSWTWASASVHRVIEGVRL